MEFLIIALALVSSAVLAVYGLIKSPKSLSHRFFALGMALLSAELAAGAFAFHRDLLVDQLQWLRIRNILSSLVPGVWLLFALSFGERDFRQRFFRWKWVVLAVFLAPLSFPLFLPGSIYKGAFIIEGAEHPVLHLGWSGYLFQLALIPGFVTLMVVLENALRFSRGIKRWQVKFLTLGVLGFFAVRIFIASQFLLFRAQDPGMALVLPSAALILSDILIAITFFRARILPEDIYLSGSFIKRSLVMIVVGAYLVTVGILTKILSLFGGPFSYQVLAFIVFAALLFLSAILFSDRLKFTLNTVVSRHLKRPRYDYRDVWMTFTARTSACRNVRDLSCSTAGLISEMLEVLKVSVWLFADGKDSLTLAGSTALSGVPIVDEGDSERIISLKTLLSAKIRPFDLFDSTDRELRQFTQEHREFLDTVGLRYCSPLRLGGQLLGFVALDDRVRGEPLGLEEYDLLGTLTDQVAANIQGLRLSEQLQHAKEMEALSKFSAFFVHDLKNVASKLSMMLQNFPRHYENPDFQRDAVNLVSQSVEKVNLLTRRMSELREAPRIKSEIGDLESVVRSSLQDFDLPAGVTIAEHYEKIPRFGFDREQVSKIVTNLVMNAIQAVGDEGRVEVQIRQQDSWAVLTVSDDGPGVEENFAATSLFQPLKTTKPNGLGIGLFQCRTIVEAHGGRISALNSTKQGTGASFEVYLPMDLKARDPQ